MAAVVPKPFVSTFNTFLASVGARDAVGKVLANSCKLAALRLKAAHGGDVDHKELVGRLDLVAKSAGTMRRFIRMGGFLKAVEAFPKVKVGGLESIVCVLGAVWFCSSPVSWTATSPSAHFSWGVFEMKKLREVVLPGFVAMEARFVFMLVLFVVD